MSNIVWGARSRYKHTPPSPEQRLATGRSCRCSLASSSARWSAEWRSSLPPALPLRIDSHCRHNADIITPEELNENLKLSEMCRSLQTKRIMSQQWMMRSNYWMLVLRTPETAVSLLKHRQSHTALFNSNQPLCLSTVNSDASLLTELDLSLWLRCATDPILVFGRYCVRVCDSAESVWDRERAYIWQILCSS